MQTVEDQTFDGMRIAMDGKFFLRCRFKGCILIFSGSDYGWQETVFLDCKVILIGPAERAVNILHYFGFAKDFGVTPLSQLLGEQSVN